MSGSGSPTRSTAVKPVEAAGVSSPSGSGLDREPLPFVAGPGRQDEIAGLARRGREPEQVGRPSRSRSIA